MVTSIGLINTPRSLHYERLYYDLDLRPWLKNVPKDKVYMDNGVLVVNKDTAVHAYLEWKYGKKYKFIYTSTKDVDDESNPFWKQSDFVYNGLYDLNSARNRGSKKSLKHMYKFIKTLAKFSKKLIIPLSYQKWTVSKCSYYNYAKKHKIPIAPFQCVRKSNSKLSIKTKVNTMMKHNIFVKPSGGWASHNTFVFNKNNSPKKVISQIEKIQPKYQEVLVAKKIEKFATTIEVRFFYIGDKLRYILGNDSEGGFYVMDYSNPKANYYNGLNEFENWVTDPPDMKKLRQFSDYTFNVMKKKMNGAHPIVTRLDFGCCGSDGNYIFNEIEYAPGLVTHMSPSQFLVDKHIGDAVIKAVKLRSQTP